MKKSVIGMIACAGLMLGGCNVDGGDSTMTRQYGTCNYIIPLNGGTPTMAVGYYDFTFLQTSTSNTVTVSTNQLSINDTKHAFECEPVAYGDNGYKQLMTGLKSSPLLSGGSTVSDGTFLISAYDAFPENFNPTRVFTPTVKTSEGKIQYVPGTVFHIQMQGTYPLVVARYTLNNNYLVKTFMCDAFYSGETNTSYNLPDGTPGTYNTKNTVYRIIIDMPNKKAALVMYNAKFSSSPKEPVKSAIYLPGLDLKFTADGRYEISGSDIIPLIPEGSVMAYPNPDTFTPQPDFKFETFKMTITNSWLTSARMDYKVGDNYIGSFSGSYVNLPTDMPK